MSHISAVIVLYFCMELNFQNFTVLVLQIRTILGMYYKK